MPESKGRVLLAYSGGLGEFYITVADVGLLSVSSYAEMPMYHLNVRFRNRHLLYSCLVD